ncbi:AGAP000178-PA-like protein [Anopheles sinensis]|uniref:AGAP000178-PA-like protein n=1 Tax=Anopheles sinensis TaxID=74873 RepID=A0A084VIL3_ANOSI|nr:AGAP000178-PA-like protein [Anopheles sinensis]
MDPYNVYKYDEYVPSITPKHDIEDGEDEADELLAIGKTNGAKGFTAPPALLNEIAAQAEDYDPLTDRKRLMVAERKDEFHQKRRRLVISPERVDPFADGGKTLDVGSRTYKEIRREQIMKGEEEQLRRKILEKAKDGTLKITSKGSHNHHSQLDQALEEHSMTQKEFLVPTWEIENTPDWQRWDDTPQHKGGTQEVHVRDATPAHESGVVAFTDRKTSTEKSKRRQKGRWDETPETVRETADYSWGETPRAGIMSGARVELVEGRTTHASKRASRWDVTPFTMTFPMAMTPRANATPLLTPGGSTPVGYQAMTMATPTPGHLAAMTVKQLQVYRWEKEIDERNRPFTDEELDAMFPQGFKIMPPPVGYNPPKCNLMTTPTSAGFFIQTENRSSKFLDNQPKGTTLPYMKPEDAPYFNKLLVEVDEAALTLEEKKERKIMRLLLKIKNGTPPMRRLALRQITEKAREFGPGPLFNQILPLLLSPTLEDQESHWLVRVIDRILYKLDDLVRPYVHKILVVIEPLLIDEDHFTRSLGREIISNLAKAAGLATMVSTMRPDIDNNDEYVRNTTARAFAVITTTFGISPLLPFLKAVCKSKISWQACHTGIRTVQQIAILMGCAILPHLKPLVEIVEHGLVDKYPKVRIITALALSALAEAANPYGIESFDSVLKPLWIGIRKESGKTLAAFLMAIGYLISLMDAEYANYYTREMMPILIREFQSPDEEMKRIILKVVKQCCAIDGVDAPYIKAEILSHFFEHFWKKHRMALARRNYLQLVDTTVDIANKVGGSEIITRVVDDLKDANEQYRKMAMETITRIVAELGTADLDSRLEEQLIDGTLYAIQEQTTEDVVMLNGFGTIVNLLGKRAEPYLPQIYGIILWLLNNKSVRVRMLAADMISRIASVMNTCEEDKQMIHLGSVLYESLGEEYPEVLGSILGALKNIVNFIGMSKMTPPISDLLPRLTPILKNRHEKVQENCIDLIGRIADRGAEYVSARQWMRVCFDLLDLFKANRKPIRRAAVNTFGYITKAIGPNDIIVTLLNNLRVQERRNRVCTTVAIATVAENCQPFTVLPALINEYRVSKQNVQNGVLKALSFLFEYIGEMGRDYIYTVCPLLEDALIDRDLVHRQIACTAIKHMALGVYGLGCEDVLNHLLNYVWPNIFETSPHLEQAFVEAVGGLRVALGPNRILQYTLQGLFHPSRKVRNVYWKIYNSLYVEAQDAIIAGYPRVANEPRNRYIRYGLDYNL